MKRLLLFFLVFNIGVLKFYAQISPSSPNTFPAIGNVGIGTLLPLEKLHVNGNVLTDGNLIVKGKIYLKSSLIGRDVSIDSSLEVKGLTTLNSLKLNLSSTNSSGSTDNTGNFQVSNLPNAKNVQETYFLRIDENGNISKSSVADPFIESSLVDPCEAFQTQYWKSQTNKKSLVTGCSDTKVGIGTDSPIYQLQVMGQSYSNQLSIGNSLQTNISDEFTALRINGRGRGSAIEIDMTEENNDYQKMFFAHFQNPQTEIFKIINKSNNTTTFYMQGNGKFYVHNGQQKTLQLDESGLLRTREVIVDANEWADFVFKESYKLPTLKYVEEYIGINGHLPEVPSEMDVLENGINVADMYKTLLLKIEELTLYTIEQQKEIEILKKQINK